MISAFALGGAVLTSRAMRKRRGARRNSSSTACTTRAATLLRRYRARRCGHPRFLDDYALFVQALLDLYEAQFDLRHLRTGHPSSPKQMRELFEDPEHGGFFSSPAGDDSLVMRMKDDYEAPSPPGIPLPLMNLLRLAQMTDRADFRQSAARTLAAFAPRLSLAPVGVTADAGGLRISV